MQRLAGWGANTQIYWICIVNNVKALTTWSGQYFIVCVCLCERITMWPATMGGGLKDAQRSAMRLHESLHRFAKIKHTYTFFIHNEHATCSRIYTCQWRQFIKFCIFQFAFSKLQNGKLNPSIPVCPTCYHMHSANRIQNGLFFCIPMNSRSIRLWLV